VINDEFHIFDDWSIACDNAGPGFLAWDTYDFKRAGKNVECIHTTGAPGTMNYNCHQDWLMGGKKS
jgi:hypothetical protein